MCNWLKLGATIAILVILSGCVADENAKRVVKPAEKMAAIYDNGTIFKPGFNERPLYEERRARNVGDGLIMNVAETTSAAKAAEKEKSASKDKKDGSEDTDRREEESQKRRDEANLELSNISSDALAGTITMTVMEVMENGNLFVVGGKQVVVDGEYKYVRISGVVDPNNIVGGNVIQSTQVSEVRIQVDDIRIRADRTAIRISEGQNVLGGLFQSMMPD